MARKAEKQKKSFLYTLFLLLAVIATVFFGNEKGKNGSDIPHTDYPFTVSIIDVGQGDCSLIKCMDSCILVDGGEAQYSDTVLNYLKKLGVEKIDCYMFSHPHLDHIGAASDIISAVPVDKFMMTSFSELNMPTTKTYEKLLDAVDESGAEVLFVRAGDEFEFGDMRVNILAPFTETDDYNDMSIVFTAEYKNVSALFTGDASVNIEKQILEAGESVESDMLKVGHHGSSSATSYAFLKAVNPEYAVISCGENNKYGHPHQETLDTLKKAGVRVLRTDKNGSLLFYSDGKKLYY